MDVIKGYQPIDSGEGKPPKGGTGESESKITFDDLTKMFEDLKTGHNPISIPMTKETLQTQAANMLSMDFSLKEIKKAIKLTIKMWKKAIKEGNVTYE